jgi:hypothetical protein
MSLASSLDSSLLNSADPAGPPKSPPNKMADAPPAKAAVVLPTKQEIGIVPAKPSSGKQYEPKQWQGVSTSLRDHDEYAQVSYGGTAPSAEIPEPPKNMMEGKGAGVSLPSAQEIGLPPAPRPAAATAKGRYEVKEWTGISSSMLETHEYNAASSPGNERRKRRDADKEARGAVLVGTVNSGKDGPQPTGKPEVKLPSSQEIGTSLGGRMARRHSVDVLPKPTHGSSAWSGVSSFSELNLHHQKSSPTPPTRHASTYQASTDQSPAEQAGGLGIPSSADLDLGPSSFRPAVRRGRAASYESYEGALRGEAHRWSGVSAVLAE